jgi:hypothetical protein
MRIIKNSFLLFSLTSLFFSTTVLSKENTKNEYSYLIETNEKPYENYTDIPFILRTKFSHGIYLDRYLQAVINDLRKVASDKKNLKQNDINLLKERKIAEQRKKQILDLIEFDINFDQKVTNNEIYSTLSQNGTSGDNSQIIEAQTIEIMRLDTDENTEISYEEMSSLSPEKQRIHDNEFRQYTDLINLDPSGDDILSDRELEILALKAFASVDKNDDKQISTEEYQVMNSAQPVNASQSFKPSGGSFGKKCTFKQEFYDLKLYAVEAASSNPLDFQIDYSDSPAVLVDLSVNIPESNVALILLGHMPTVWNLAIEPSTKIKAVFLGGNSAQRIYGLDNNIPIINNQMRDDNGNFKDFNSDLPCGREILIDWGISSVRELSQYLFKNDNITILKTDAQGQAYLGEKNSSIPFQNYEFLKSSYKIKNSFSPSLKGLEEAEKAGVIRKADENDLEKWIDILEQKAKKDINMIPISGKSLRDTLPKFSLERRTYVILKDFVFPTSLHGANSANFIISKGITPPKGQSGHSSVYDMNTATCSGPLAKC